MATRAAARRGDLPFRLIGWLGSKPLRRVIQLGAGCGCELRLEAEREENWDDAEIMRSTAPAMQAMWRCPTAGFEPCASASELPSECQETLVAVERLTGLRGARTCPLYYTRLPWVHRVARAHRWAERGELRIVEPTPSAALVAALDACDAGLSARRTRDAEDSRRELEEMRAQHRSAHDD